MLRVWGHWFIPFDKKMRHVLVKSIGRHYLRKDDAITFGRHYRCITDFSTKNASCARWAIGLHCSKKEGCAKSWQNQDTQSDVSCLAKSIGRHDCGITDSSTKIAGCAYGVFELFCSTKRYVMFWQNSLGATIVEKPIHVHRVRFMAMVQRPVFCDKMMCYV